MLYHLVEPSVSFSSVPFDVIFCQDKPYSQHEKAKAPRKENVLKSRETCTELAHHWKIRHKFIDFARW